MIWANVLVFLVATVKFLFAAAAGKAVPGNTFLITFLVISAGGIFGMTVFYYFTEYVSLLFEKVDWLSKGWKNFIIWIKKVIGAKEKPKRKFTKFNRFIVRMKHNPYGLYIIALLGASFISIPIGAILAAKFYDHRKETVFVLYAAVLLMAFITTFIAYLF